MKVANKLVSWAHEPWTVVHINHPADIGSRQQQDMFYAYNTKTGERKPSRYNYDKAFADIPASPNAEPWGV